MGFRFYNVVSYNVPGGIDNVAVVMGVDGKHGQVDHDD